MNTATHGEKFLGSWLVTITIDPEQYGHYFLTFKEQGKYRGEFYKVYPKTEKQTWFLFYNINGSNIDKVMEQVKNDKWIKI